VQEGHHGGFPAKISAFSAFRKRLLQGGKRDLFDSHLKRQEYEHNLHQSLLARGNLVCVHGADDLLRVGFLLDLKDPLEDEPRVSIVLRDSPGSGIQDFAAWDVFRYNEADPMSTSRGYQESLHAELANHLFKFSQGLRFEELSSVHMPSSSAVSSRHMLPFVPEAAAGVSVNGEEDRVDRASSSSEKPSGSGGEPPDDEPDDPWDYVSDGSSKSRRRERHKRPPKFSVDKVNIYSGRNDWTDDEENYHWQPHTWAKRAYSLLHGQGVDKDWIVWAALHCVSTPIQEEYVRLFMAPQDGKGEWELYDAEFRPPRPQSLIYSHFAKWLSDRFKSTSMSVKSLQDRLRNLRQGREESVFDHNAKFNRLLRMIHDLRLMHDKAYAKLHEGMAIGERIEFREDRLTYLDSIHPHLAEFVHRWIIEKGLDVVFGPARASIDELSRDRIASRVQLDGADEPDLKQLQEGAVVAEVKVRERPDFYRTWLRGRQPDPFRSRHSPSPPRRRLPPPARINNLEAEFVVDAELAETDLELLFQKLSKEGRLGWTRAQLKKLFNEDRCFQCAQKGHKSSECRNPRVNPRDCRFDNLVEICCFDEEEDLLFHALSQFDAGNGQASL
jgi:hypothetical protein